MAHQKDIRKNVLLFYKKRIELVRRFLKEKPGACAKEKVRIGDPAMAHQKDIRKNVFLLSEKLKLILLYCIEINKVSIGYRVIISIIRRGYL